MEAIKLSHFAVSYVCILGPVIGLNGGAGSAGVENMGAVCKGGKYRSRQSMESRKNKMLYQ